MQNVYIVAEAGVNHNGNLELAHRLIDCAANAGVNAVKFQTFNAEKLVTKTTPKAKYQQDTTDPTESQLEMLKKLELSNEWYLELFNHAQSLGVEFLSTPFDFDSLDFLKDFEMPFFKVASGELTNSPLLWSFARLGKPLVVSTGMATMSEVEQALAVISHAFNTEHEPRSMNEVWQAWSNSRCRMRLKDRVTLLHCTSQYPTPMSEVNLKSMHALKSFGLPVGYSDHTEGIMVPLAAVALGATLIEKHFTLDKKMPGPDHKASLEPLELAAMVRQIRDLEKAMGDGVKSPQQSELNVRLAARQYIVAAKNIRSGQVIAKADLSTARTGGGMPASLLWDLVGQVSSRDYLAGEVIANAGI